MKNKAKSWRCIKCKEENKVLLFNNFYLTKFDYFFIYKVIIMKKLLQKFIKIFNQFCLHDQGI